MSELRDGGHVGNCPDGVDNLPGKPVWNEEDFQQLLFTLGYAGYGSLRPEGVRRELEKVAAEWKGPPLLF